MGGTDFLYNKEGIAKKSHGSTLRTRTGFTFKKISVNPVVTSII